MLKKSGKGPRNWIQFVLGLSKQKTQPAAEKNQVHYHIHVHIDKEKTYQNVLAMALSELPLSIAPITDSNRFIRIPYQVQH